MPPARKKVTSALREEQIPLFNPSILDGYIIAQSLILGVLDKFDREIRMKEALVKLPQYNIDIVVQFGAEASSQGVRKRDQKFDDIFLYEEIEPIPTTCDHYQTDTKQIKTYIKMDAASELDSSPTKSIVSRKYTKVSKSIQGENRVVAPIQTNDEWKNREASGLKVSVQDYTQLNELDWRKPPTYNDDVPESHLENLRKFIMKKREFQNSTKIVKVPQKKNSSITVADANAKQTGLIFDRGMFIKSKRINPETLPNIDYSLGSISYQTPSEVQVQKGQAFEQIKDVVSKLKVEYEKKKIEDAEKQQLDDVIKNYGHKGAKKKVLTQRSRKISSLWTNKDDSTLREEDNSSLVDEIVINQSELIKYNPNKKMITLIANKPEERESVLSTTRGHFHSSYGVSYVEKTAANNISSVVKSSGKSFYQDPAYSHKMRKMDLFKKQSQEQEQMIKTYKNLGKSITLDKMNDSLTLDFNTSSFLNQKSIDTTYNEITQTDREYMRISEFQNNEQTFSLDHRSVQIKLPLITTTNSQSRNFSFKKYDKVNSISSNAKSLLMAEDVQIKNKQSFQTPSSLSKVSFDFRGRNIDVLNNSISYSLNPLSTINSMRSRKLNK